MMKLSTEDINHYQPVKDIFYRFSHSIRNQRVVNETVLPLLEYRPLPPDTHIPEDSTAFVVPRPQSFEDPFDDPSLEPLPLKSNNGQEAQQLVSMAFHNNVSHHILLQTEQMGVARVRPFQDEKWKASFQRLVEFKHKYGHSCVPHSYIEDRALALWVKRQRHQYKKFQENDPTSTLTTSRYEQLMAIGFVWDSHHAAWMEKLNELKAFKARSGHCNVPSTYKENSALSTWVKSQRRQYKLYASGSPSSMTTPRFQALKSLGFVFDPRQKTSSKKVGQR